MKDFIRQHPYLALLSSAVFFVALLLAVGFLMLRPTLPNTGLPSRTISEISSREMLQYRNETIVPHGIVYNCIYNFYPTFSNSTKDASVRRVSGCQEVASRKRKDLDSVLSPHPDVDYLLVAAKNSIDIYAQALNELNTALATDSESEITDRYADFVHKVESAATDFNSPSLRFEEKYLSGIL